MPRAAAVRASLISLLVRLVFGVRRAVLHRPAVRAVLRALGRPAIALMHRLAGPGAAPPSVRPGAAGEPVLRLPLDYQPGELKPAPKIAILLLVTGHAGLPALMERLRALPFGAELMVTLATAADGVDEALAGWSGAVDVRPAPAGTRGLAAQLAAYPEVADREGLVLALEAGSEDDGRQAFLHRNLAGSEAVARAAAEIFAQLPALGLLAPRTWPADRALMAWGEAYDSCRRQAERWGLPLYPDSPADFPPGGMFWARPAALKPLVEAGASERLAFYACEAAGLRWAWAGDDIAAAPPETFWRADSPRRLQRAVTDCGRAVAVPGRAPAGHLADKAEFRALCRRELEAFLAGGERLALPTSGSPKVSILLVLFNQAELTYQCLKSLRFGLEVPAEVVILDNASSDDTRALLARVDGARVIESPENLHFVRGVNRAADLARGELLLLLNNDARLRPGALSAAVERLDAEPDLGAVGGRIELLDGTLQEAGSIVWADGACEGYGRGGDPWAGEFLFRRDVDYASGAFLMTRRALFDRLGRLDEAFAPAYYEETDLCLRLREAGLRVGYEPRALISHFEFGSAGASQAIALQRAHQDLFARRHAATLRAGHRLRSTGPLVARMRGRHAGRVLILEDQVPFPRLGAGYPRARDLLQAVTEAGWFATFYPLVHGDVDYEAAWRIVSPEVEFAAEREQAGLAAFLRERAGYYDAVLVSRPHNMAAFRQALAQIPGFIRPERVIYDAEAIFALRGGGGDPAAETALAAGAGAVLAVSAAEAEAFRRAGCSNVRVLGHALAADPTPAPFDARRDLLFVGAADEDASPNADSLVFFVREVMPRLDELIGADYVLRVAGRSGAPSVRALASERVRLLGPVDDLRGLYDRSRVFVAPTRFAAGIPMKAHAAAAAGLPTAATPLLAGQLGWSDGEALAVGDGAEGFARAVQRLYRDPQLWAQVRAGALGRIAAECDPGAFKATVAEVLASVRRA